MEEYKLPRYLTKEYEDEFKKIRPQIFERDNYLCKKCGCEKASNVHHIIARANGGTNEEKNLILLCSQCHHEWDYSENTIPFDVWLTYPSQSEFIAMWRILSMTEISSLMKMNMMSFFCEIQRMHNECQKGIRRSDEQIEENKWIWDFSSKKLIEL